MKRPSWGTAAALVAGLLAAKVVAVATVPAVGTRWWALPWDDVATGLAVAALASALPRLARIALLALCAGHCALSMLMVRALGMPLLPTMLRGVDPAMQDSVAPYLTFANGLCLAAVAASAALAARLAQHRRVARTTLLAGAALAALVAAAMPAPAHGAHRNALVAFTRGLLPRPIPEFVDAHEGAIAASGPQAAPVAPLVGTPGLAAGRSVVVVVLESAAARFVAPEHGPGAMPFLRSLMARGLDCPTCWAVYPESIEGQVALFCGLPPIPDAEPTDYRAHGRAALPHRLRPHGYRSGLFHAGRFAFLGMHDVLAPMGFDTLADAATIGGERESSFGIDEEATVDALLAWVGSMAAQQRVLACYLPIAGHHPYASPAGGPFPTDDQLGCYRNALHYADRALRRLWEGLCRLRPPEQWLLCVVGDHGQAFGEHPGNFGHSFELYEENLRVPLLFVAPGSGLAGLSSDAPCSHLDVVPTLLDLLGLGDGPSLLRPGPGAGRVAAFTDWGELLVGARDGEWKLVHDVVAARDRLFDLGHDPHERHDVAAAHAGTAERLRQQALRFLAAAQRGGGR